MKRILPLVIGIVAVAIGAVWTLQGLGYLAGSAMTDERIWAVIGPIVALVGIVLIIFGARARRT
jgi:drug/metabolite transporter superfamily protein YnfA